MAALLPLLNALDFDLSVDEGRDLTLKSPIDGVELAHVRAGQAGDVDGMIQMAVTAANRLAMVPMATRAAWVGGMIADLQMRAESVAQLLTLETGLTLADTRREVGQTIEVGYQALSIMQGPLGSMMAVPAPGHSGRAVAHPLGVVGIISAFTHPLLMALRHTFMAVITGNAVVIKPSERAFLTLLAMRAMASRVQATIPGLDDAPPVLQVITGGRETGAHLVAHSAVALVAGAGSTSTGRAVAEAAGSHLTSVLMHLSTHNGMMIAPSADKSLALQAMMQGLVMGNGQAPLALRRVIMHETLYDALMPSLLEAVQSVVVGDPRIDGVMMGPLADANAFVAMQAAIKHAQDDGGTLAIGGTRVSDGVPPGGIYVRPAVVVMGTQTDGVLREVTAPLLYVMVYRNFAEGLALLNAAPQQSVGAILTNHLREAELFTSAQGYRGSAALVNAAGTSLGTALPMTALGEGGMGVIGGDQPWRPYVRLQAQVVNYSGVLG